MVNHYNYKIKREYVPKVISIKTSKERAGKISLSSLISSKFNMTTLVSIQQTKSDSKQDIENLLIELNYLDLTNLLVSSPHVSTIEKLFCRNKQSKIYNLIKQVSNMNMGIFLNNKNNATEFCMGFKIFHPDNFYSNRTSEILQECLNLTKFTITEPIYEYNSYEKIMEKIEQWNIKNPIIPEVELLDNLENIKSNKNIPKYIKNQFNCFQEQNSKKQAYIDYTAKLCEKLLTTAPGIHFTTEKKPLLLNEILSRLS